jgi:hypothetical protein
MPENRFSKGDVVRFSYGPRTITGTVKEDRGPIGVGGRRLYAVEFRLDRDSDSPSVIELPANELQATRRVATAR